MTESNTRKWWRARIKGIMLDAIGPAKVYDMNEVDRKVDGWLDDLMQTPELSLAELAESNLNYRLAVVDIRDNERFFVGGVEYDHYPVVKMEEK